MSQELITRATFTGIEKAMQQAGFDPEQAKREISFAIQHINKSAQLQKCSQQTILQSVLNVSNLELSLNPASKESYLIPRWSSITNSMECVLEPSYVGLVKLLTDAGSIKSMLCNLVYENDTFTVDLANNSNPVKHLPQMNRSKRGEIIGVYALATLYDNNRQVEWMDIADVNYIKERSETFKSFTAGKIKSCTWVTDFGEMARKTVVKRIYKYLPRTERMQKVDEAITIDNSDFTASDDQLSYIDSLLHTSTLDESQRTNIEMEMTIMTASRASEVISNLKNNQQPSDKELLKRLSKQPQ